MVGGEIRKMHQEIGTDAVALRIYRRGDQFEKRRRLMEAWAAF